MFSFGYFEIKNYSLSLKKTNKNNTTVSHTGNGNWDPFYRVLPSFTEFYVTIPQKWSETRVMEAAWLLFYRVFTGFGAKKEERRIVKRPWDWPRFLPSFFFCYRVIFARMFVSEWKKTPMRFLFDFLKNISIRPKPLKERGNRNSDLWLATADRGGRDQWKRFVSLLVSFFWPILIICNCYNCQRHTRIGCGLADPFDLVGQWENGKRAPFWRIFFFCRRPFLLFPFPFRRESPWSWPFLFLFFLLKKKEEETTTTTTTTTTATRTARPKSRRRRKKET